MLDQIRNEAKLAAQQLCEIGKLKKGQILVVGCSSSEVAGHKVGTHSSPEIGQALFEAIQEVLVPQGIFLAAQCCEHLNRAIIVERAAVPFADICNVVPQPKAGGSFATTVWERMSDPVAVERIRAHAGMDVGATLIGMHLRRVAVPVRLSINRIGEASLVCARTRPAYIGGPRAQYQTEEP
jgi:uncharacterized protein (TIGR01440 family)